MGCLMEIYHHATDANHLQHLDYSVLNSVWQPPQPPTDSMHDDPPRLNCIFLLPPNCAKQGTGLKAPASPQLQTQVHNGIIHSLKHTSVTKESCTCSLILIP